MKTVQDKATRAKPSAATRSSHVALAVLFLAWVIGQCQKTAIGVAVIPIGKEFGFNSVELGWIISSFFASYAIITFFGGMIADRYGARLTLTASIAGWSALTAATGFAWSLPTFIATRLACGAAEGSFPSASSVAIAELYPVEQRGRAKTFIVSAGQIGIGVSTLVVAAFIATLGWRYAFWTYSAVGIAIAAAFWMSYRPAHGAADSAIPAPKRIPALRIVRSKLALIMFLIQFSSGTFFFGLSSWLPTYWVQVKGLSILEMSSLTAGSAFVAFAIQNFFGWVMDRYLPRKEKYLILACLLIAVFGLYAVYTTSDPTFAMIALSVVTTSIGVASTAIFVIAVKYFPKGTIGAATGVANFGQQSAAVIAPLVFGYFINAFGGSYLAVFVFATATVVVAFCAALAINTEGWERADHWDSATA